MSKKLRIEVVEGETEHISFSGRRIRKPTVFLRVGSRSLSKRAFTLGLLLAICQVLDGVLTYIGLSHLGIHMEGNKIIGVMMYSYGLAPALFIIKIAGLMLVVMLTLFAHNRPWIRHLIVFTIGIYLVLAVIPWTYIITEGHLHSAQEMTPKL